MNGSPASTPTNRSRLVVAVLLAAAGMVALFQVLQTFFWNTLTALARAIIVQYRTFPQDDLWSLLLLAAAGLSLFSLYWPGGRQGRAEDGSAAAGRGRVSELAALVRHRRAQLFKTQLNQLLTTFYIRAAALQLRGDESGIKEAVREGSIELPPDLRSFYRKGLLRWSDHPAGDPWEVRQRSTGDANFDLLAIKAIDHLEEMLETNHDDRNS